MESLSRYLSETRIGPLETPADGSSGGCVELEADLAKALTDNPGGYYVNVHKAAYPGGAVRAQLRG